MHYGSLPKKTSIKGQPHELSYITPQEAGVLRMLGGSGESFKGIPAYNHQPGHGTSIAAGYSQMADTLSQAPGGAVSLSGKKVGDTKDDDPAPTTDAGKFNLLSPDAQMAILIAHNAKAKAEMEAAAVAEAAKAAETLASGDVSPTSTVQMVNTATGPQVLTSTNVGSGTQNTYLDPEVYKGMGYELPSGVMITSSDNVSSPMLDATKPVDTTGFAEDLMLAGQDIGQLFDPSLGNLMGTEEEQGDRALGSGVEQSFYVPGLNDPDRSVMAESAADAFNMVDMERFDNIRADDPLFDIDPANVLSYDELASRGMVDPITGDVGRQEFMTDGVYGDDVGVPYDFYGAPFNLGYDDNGNLVEVPLGDGITIPGTDITITAPPPSGGNGGGSSSLSPKQNLFNKVFGQISKFGRGGGNHYTLRRFGLGGERIELQGYLDESGENYVLSDNTIIPVEEAEKMFNIAPMDTEILQTSIPYYPRNAYDFQTPTMTDEQYNFSSPSNVPQNLTSNTGTLSNTVFK
jgi:hypothetical protein